MGQNRTRLPVPPWAPAEGASGPASPPVAVTVRSPRLLGVCHPCQVVYDSSTLVCCHACGGQLVDEVRGAPGATADDLARHIEGIEWVPPQVRRRYQP